MQSAQFKMCLCVCSEITTSIELLSVNMFLEAFKKHLAYCWIHVAYFSNKNPTFEWFWS